ncbi:MAG: KTSC domain-containing protein [Bacteroidia bacterium]
MLLNESLNRLLDAFIYKKVISSNISNVGYDKSNSSLAIKFSSGSIYQYLNVPIKIFNAMIKAPSKGKFANKYI